MKDQALAHAVNNNRGIPASRRLRVSVRAGKHGQEPFLDVVAGRRYYNQQQDVMDAIQVMRQKAEQAGTLKSTSQQTVTSGATTS